MGQGGAILLVSAVSLLGIFFYTQYLQMRSTVNAYRDLVYTLMCKENGWRYQRGQAGDNIGRYYIVYSVSQGGASTTYLDHFTVRSKLEDANRKCEHNRWASVTQGEISDIQNAYKFVESAFKGWSSRDNGSLY